MKPIDEGTGQIQASECTIMELKTRGSFCTEGGTFSKVHSDMVLLQYDPYFLWNGVHMQNQNTSFRQYCKVILVKDLTHLT